MYLVSLLQVLHGGKTNKNTYKALIAAEYSGVKVELAPDFEMGVSNKTPKFIKMNPIGKVNLCGKINASYAGDAEFYSCVFGTMHWPSPIYYILIWLAFCIGKENCYPFHCMLYWNLTLKPTVIMSMFYVLSLNIFPLSRFRCWKLLMALSLRATP